MFSATCQLKTVYFPPLHRISLDNTVFLKLLFSTKDGLDVHEQIADYYIIFYRSGKYSDSLMD